MPDKMLTRHLSAWFGKTRAVNDVNLNFADHQITAIIGPSGCGKSTLLRCLNRLHEEVPGARVEGEVVFDGADIYSADVSPVRLRRRIGMVFQKPTPFPTMSVEDNVAAGLTLAGISMTRSQRAEVVERCLQHAALWDEVKDKLGYSGLSLSVDSSSVFVSLEHSQSNPRCCCWTSRVRRSIRFPPRASKSCCSSSEPNLRSSSLLTHAAGGTCFGQDRLSPDRRPDRVW